MSVFGWLDKLAGAYFDWRMRANMRRLEDVRFESITQQTIDGKPVLEVVATFAPIMDFASRCIDLLDSQNAKNFVVIRMMPRPDHGNRPIDVTVRWADTGVSPAHAISVMDKALREIADWDKNYNLGGDPKVLGWHPAKVAEVALKELGHAV